MNAPAISMIVLAYQDALSLPAVVRELDLVLRSLADEHEIVVVDDGSQDQTASVVEALAREYALVSKRHPTNRGVGAAFETGVSASRFDRIGYIDGDGQYVVEDLRILVALLESADAASGIRTDRADLPTRRLISAVYNLVLRQLFGLDRRDANCGLKLFTRRFLETVGPLHSAGPFYDAELLVKGQAAGLTIAEAPVRHRPRRHGTARGASLASITSAIEGMTNPNMRPYWRQAPGARILGRLLRLAVTLTPG